MRPQIIHTGRRYGKTAATDDLRDIMEANHAAIERHVQKAQCKYAPYVQDGEVRWAPDQIERHRRRKKYRKAYENSGNRKKGHLTRRAGRMRWEP